MKEQIAKPFTLGRVDPEEKEDLRFLRTNFLRATEENAARVILVGNDRNAEETSQAVLKLAYALTAMGKSVLVADCDCANAWVTALAGVDTKQTYNAYLEGKIEAKALPQKTGVEGLSVVCAERARSERMEDDLATRKMVQALREGYDYVFLSVMPASMGADLFSYDEIADAVMLFVKQKQSTHRFLKTMLEYYGRRGTKVLGISMI